VNAPRADVYRGVARGLRNRADMRLQTAIAGAGLLIAMSAAPVAGFTVLAPPAPSLFASPIAEQSAAPSRQPGYGDFGGPGNPYGPDASPTGIHSGGGAFSDQKPADGT
jgi:hypothetical protein